MIQYGEDKYIPDLKEMWKLCFPSETEAFTLFYFDKIYKNQETLLYVENGRPVASLQILPYSIKVGDDNFLAGYISGAMTHPEFQNKGYMDQLLNTAFIQMDSRKCDYTFLIPQEEWLFGFYAKHGYTTFNNVKSDDYSFIFQDSEKEIGVFTHFDEVDISHLHLFYHAHLQQNENVVIKVDFQFENILRNFFEEDGVLFAEDCGMAFTFKDKDKIIIKEFFYSDDETKEKFLHIIKKYYSLDEISFADRPKGMIKRLNDSAPEITDIYMSMMLD